MDQTTEIPRGAEVQRRLAELRDGAHDSDLDRAERFALCALDRAGFETLNVIGYTGSDRWQVWAYETIVWTARRLRGREYRAALRGWGQLREYVGRCGGFLPGGGSDHVVALQNALERVI